MKQTLTVFLCCLLFIGKAQPTFTLTPSASTREYTEVSGCDNGNYIVKETARTIHYRDKGKLTLYSSEQKKITQINYQLPLKIINSAITEPILNKDKMILLSGTFITLVNEGERVPFWDLVMPDGIVRQDYNPKTLEPIGKPQTLPYTTDKTFYNFKFVRSPDGNNFAIWSTDMHNDGLIKYSLNNNSGEVFTKEFTLPGIIGTCKSNKESAVMNNKGDLAFQYSDSKREEDAENFVALVSASKQKLYAKKLKVPGKSVYMRAAVTLTKDGGLIVAAPYCTPAKTTTHSIGMLVEKYSADMQLQYHAEIPYSAETMEAFKKTQNDGVKGTLFKQMPIKIHEMESGGYVLVTEQQFRIPYGNNYLNIRNDILCIGMNDKLENQYQNVVRVHESNSDLYCCDLSGSYAVGDRVYIFHRGENEKLKNTPDEFDFFCTWWEHGKTQPQRLEVNRPDSDFRIFPQHFYEFEKNKLLFLCNGKGGGDVYSTLQIEQK
ncbi:MAG: hypothetical protein NTY88_02710 [Bacteroidetes bacterium]|nr:hypothetical protein [Bacteroidota bacterium]